MCLVETKINIGLKTPFKILHVSDTHLTEAYDSDGREKVLLSQKRHQCDFPNNNEMFQHIKIISRKKNLTIIHSGDLIDFVSKANLDMVKKFTDEYDVFMAAGNHEFAQQIGGVIEDKEYRDQSLEFVQKSFKNDIRFSVSNYYGIRFIAIDNSYYKFEKWQYEKLVVELQKEIPTVLVMHNPIFEINLFNRCINENADRCAYLVAVPDELINNYTKERYFQQKSDYITNKTVNMIKSSNCIKAILCGHIHKNYEGMLTSKIRQISTSFDTIRLIEFF